MEVNYHLNQCKTKWFNESGIDENTLENKGKSQTFVSSIDLEANYPKWIMKKK